MHVYMLIYLCIYAYVSIVIVRYIVIYAVMNTHRFAHCADRRRHRLLLRQSEMRNAHGFHRSNLPKKVGLGLGLG